MIFCILTTLFSELSVVKGENNNFDSNIEISFELINHDTGELVESAEIFVIEGWTGTIIEQKIIQSEDVISILPNHSFRFKLINENFDTWYSKSEMFSSNKLITVNFSTDGESYEAFLDNQVNNTGGEVELVFLEQMSSNSNLSLSWSANYNLSMHFGTNLLPFNHLGLSGQIDYLFGDKDTILENNEKELFLDWFSQQGWSDPFFGGCCRVDDNFIESDDLTSTLNPWIDTGLGVWGWNETNLFSVKSGFTGNRLLEVPLQNDIRQLANLVIETPVEWEFRYSPNIDWISGHPTKINVNRSTSGIIGYLPIIFGKNTPPDVRAQVIDYQGSSLPLNDNITLDGTNSVDSSHNIGLGPNLDCLWQISQDDIIHEKESSMIWTLNVSEFGFLPNSTIITRFICEDPQGLSDLWEKSWYLDITPPIPSELFGDAECMDSPEIENLLFCENLLVESSKELKFNFTFSDDGPITPAIIWESNHIEGWFSEESEMKIIFWQGQNSNINFLGSNHHHQQRELAIWNLDVTISDEVENSYFKSWNITVLDRSAPRIIMKLLDDDKELDILNDINFGDNITLDINSSYDNIDAIEKLNFVIKLNGHIIAESNQSTWNQIKSLNLDNLEVGIHQLSINVTDSSGNSAENKYEFFVFPPNDLSILDIELIPFDKKLVVGENNLEFRIVNSGSKPYDLIICIQEQCLDSNGLGATIDGYGYSNISLVFDLNKSESLDVNYRFKDGSETIEYNVTYQFEFKSEKNNIVIIGLISFLVCLSLIITIKFIVNQRVGKV